MKYNEYDCDLINALHNRLTSSNILICKNYILVIDNDLKPKQGFTVNLNIKNAFFNEEDPLNILIIS